MGPDVRQFRVGATTVTAINAADWHSPKRWADVIDVPEAEWRAQYAAVFDRRLSLPCYSFHITSGRISALVDVGPGMHSPEDEYPGVIVEPATDLVDALAKFGVATADITDVVITHAHLDHYAGITVARDGVLSPVFPNARCWLGAPELEATKQRGQPDSLPNRTFAVFERLGSLRLVTQATELAAGVHIVPAPGETAGHCIVRLRSGAQTAYFTGDLFHLACEIERPEWGLKGRDHHVNLASRRALFTAALEEHALLFASHFPGVGRLSVDRAGRCSWTSSN